MKLPSINLDEDQISRFDDAVQKEWLVTNGLGGYASGTALGINTRKYHGLLVAAFHPPGDRRVCLEKIDEEVCIGNSVYPLGANESQNGVFPQGYRFLKQFSVSPFPRYVYAVQDVEVRKTVFMPHEKNMVVVVYRLFNGGSVDAKIRAFPLVNWRHFHSVTDRWRNPVEFAQRHGDRELSIRVAAPRSALIMAATDGVFRADGKWLERVLYREEAQRGESALDDCYLPGCFEIEAKTNRSGTFAIVTVADENDQSAQKTVAEMPLTMYDVETAYEKELKRNEDFLTKFWETHESVARNDWLSWLILASDSFIVKGLAEQEKSVIAGYHWFETWGRDTFVSLPGLMLITGRFEEARQVFLGFKRYCKDGLIPNYIPDRAEMFAYNTVDATLWYVNAVLQHLKYTGDFGFVREQLWDTLKMMIDAHVKGTAFGISMDSDGLLSHGPQLTWVDSAVNGQPVNPRAGKAVEIQALWYNAMKIMELLANKYEETAEAERYGRIAEKTRKSFVEKFWNGETDFLLDVVGDAEKDSSLMPNQIIAVALNFSMLDGSKNEKIVDILQRELLTPFGLRTRATNDPKYIGIYAGNRGNRDRAYHNGTVWPWLLGPFVTAYLKAKGFSEFRRELAANFLVPLFSRQITEAGLGYVGEIFDGESPHSPKGCIAQAWSIAEPLIAYVEDVTQIRPKYEKEILKILG